MDEAGAALVEEPRKGAQLLHLALELDRRIYCGVSCSYALAELKLMGGFYSRMLEALVDYSPTRAEFEVRQLSIRELSSGMALDKDVTSIDGNLLILKGGTVLTETWIERLQNFAKARGAQELLDVRIPRLAGILKPETPVYSEVLIA